MAELWFYHLERSGLDRVLPELLEKTLARGWRAHVETGSAEHAEALSAQLWTYRDEAFLPHGTPSDGHIEHQPILIAGDSNNRNRADALFVVDPASAALPPERLSVFQRTILIFDGNDPQALEAARAHWRRAKEAGIAASYWQQSGEGRWEKKA